MRIWLGATLVALCLSGSAFADLKYTMEMNMGQRGTTVDTTTYVQGMHQRVVTSMQMGPMHADTTTLTLCDKDQTLRIDDALKIYTAESITNPAMAMGSNPMAPKHETACTGGSGTVDMTYNIQDLGADKVNGIDTRHVMMNIAMKRTGCAGTGDSTLQIEEWFSNIKAFSCPAYTQPHRVAPNVNGCQITYTMHGNVDKFASLLGGMPARIKLGSAQGAGFISEIKDYSISALDAGLFVVPSDYKQVSASEFQQAESQKMMQQMRGGMPQQQQPEH